MNLCDAIKQRMNLIVPELHRQTSTQHEVRLNGTDWICFV